MECAPKIGDYTGYFPNINQLQELIYHFPFRDFAYYWWKCFIEKYICTVLSLHKVGLCTCFMNTLFQKSSCNLSQIVGTKNSSFLQIGSKVIHHRYYIFCVITIFQALYVLQALTQQRSCQQHPSSINLFLVSHFSHWQEWMLFPIATSWI